MEFLHLQIENPNEELTGSIENKILQNLTYKRFFIFV